MSYQLPIHPGIYLLLIAVTAGLTTWFTPAGKASEALTVKMCPEYKGAVISLSVTHVGEQYVKCAYVQTAAQPGKPIARTSTGGP